MAALLAGVLAHEGMGTVNGGNGHEGLARAAAAEQGNDPYVEHFGIVEPDSAKVVARVQTTAVDIGFRLNHRSDDSTTTAPSYPVPSGNWPGGPYWTWQQSLGSRKGSRINGF